MAIYRLLDKVSPLKTDCGLLCGAACCSSTDANMGIYLLPGEEKMFSRKETWLKWQIESALDFDFPDSWTGKIHFIRCTNAPNCPRKLRPLQCRFFPLAPHLTEDGLLVIIRYTSELPYLCPLIENKTQLMPSYSQVVYTVWKRLIKDPIIYDLVRFDSNDRNKDLIDIVYPIL